MNTFLLILIAIVGGLGVCLALGFMGVAPFNALSATVAGYVGNFNLGSVLSNPAAILTTIGGVTAVAIPLYKKVMEYKAQALTLKTQAQQQISQYSGALNTATTQLKTATTSLSSAETAITSLTATKTALEAEVARLQSQVERAASTIHTLEKTTAAEVIASFPAGSTITKPDGSTVSVVEKVVVK